MPSCLKKEGGESSGTIVLSPRATDMRGTPIVCHRTPEDTGGAQATILGPRAQESGGGGGGGGGGVGGVGGGGGGGGVGGGTQGTILEDDQQLYDWGIENRLDQYTYQVSKQQCVNH